MDRIESRDRPAAKCVAKGEISLEVLWAGKRALDGWCDGSVSATEIPLSAFGAVYSAMRRAEFRQAQDACPWAGDVPYVQRISGGRIFLRSSVISSRISDEIGKRLTLSSVRAIISFVTNPVFVSTSDAP